MTTATPKDLTLTSKEVALLHAINAAVTAEGSDAVQYADVCDHLGDALAEASVPGVLGSLVRKGFAWSDDPGVAGYHLVGLTAHCQDSVAAAGLRFGD